MSTISSVSGYTSAYTSTSSASRAQRPDPAKLAEALFAKMDTGGQGYLQQSDFETAFGNISSTSSTDSTSTASATSSSSTSTASADALFKAMDSNGDGKLTQTELTDTLKKLSSQLDGHFQHSRTHGSGSAPPPPPSGDADGDGDNDAGLTKDQLTTMASQISSSDPQAASLMSTAAANFDKADTNGDGKVSFKEAMARQQSLSSTTISATSDMTSSGSTESSTSDASTSSGSSSTTGTHASNGNQELFGQLMKLLSAYGLVGNEAQGQSASASSTLSVTA